MNQESSKLSRATTLKELESVLDKFFDETKTPLGLAFKPHASDIIITPYANVVRPGYSKLLTGCVLEETWISTRLRLLPPGLKSPMIWVGI
jgi:hypothetical protein